MQRVLSTYRFVDEPLTPTLLADIAHAGVPSIEIFCSQGHFNYRAPKMVRDLMDWLSEHQLQVSSLHAPTERTLVPGKRETGVPISISEPERVRRLDAVDEIKRVIEVAERIPFPVLVLHLTHGRQAHDPKKLDAAFSSVEHLVVFAKQRGVTIALENTPGELASPSTLMHFIKDTHLNDLRLCFDAGHAHMEDGVEVSLDAMRERIITAHLHDNHGQRDEHLLPFEGTIDWDIVLQGLAGTRKDLPMVLELKQQQATNSPTLQQATSVFEKLEHRLASKRAPAAGN